MATNKTDTLILLRQGDLENLSKVPVTEGALYVAKKKDSEGKSISAQLYVDLDSKRLSFKEEAAGENLGLVKSGGDVTITDGIISVNDNSHNHTISAGHSDDDVVILTGTAGTNSVTYNASHAEKGPANGYSSANAETSVDGYGDTATIKIPQITVDKYGHVTAATDQNITITMPEAQTIVEAANKWKTARTLTLAGAVEGSADLDGSTNVTLTVGENITGNLIGNADTATQWSSSISLKIGDIAQSLNGTEDLTYDLYDIIGDLGKFQETVVLPITNVLSEEIEVINTNIDIINEEIVDIRDKYLLKTDLISTLEQYVPYSHLNQIATYTSEGTDLILHNNINGSSQIKMTNSGIDLAADGTILLSIADNSIIGQNYIVKDYLQIGEGSNKLQFKYEGTAGYSLMI